MPQAAEYIPDQEERDRFVADFQDEEYQESPEQIKAKEQEMWAEKLQVFGNGVEAEAEEFERYRKPHETRMLIDMRQYMGVQDAMERRVKKSDDTKSDLNVNITRKKTNTAEAKLSDMLFPSDDENWSIDPTPIPSLAVQGNPGAENQQPVAPQPEQPQQQLPVSGQKVMDAGQAIAPGQHEVVIEETPEEKAMRAAKARAELMAKEIKDQLTECNYDAVGREVIRYGCLLGLGVMKGPVLVGKTRKAWVEKSDDKGNIVHVLEQVEDYKPGYEFVPTWDFFPTLSATKIGDSEVNYQRHWMTRKDLIKLAKRKDFLPDQIRQVLRKSPDKTPPDYLTQLRSMSDVTAVGEEKRYVVWERHGPIDVEQLQACGALPHDYEVDELEEFQGIVWVCQGIVIKAAINPLETGDTLFSTFSFEEDDSSIFGYGVPYLTREPQKVVTRSWQMIMDNSGLSVGGQIIINKSIIEPAPAADDTESWDITPLKVWLMKDKNGRAQDAFHIFEFPNHQQELAQIFNMAMQLADEESGIPPVAEGASGQHQTQTAHGMEMLMNSHNIVMRRAVKNFDDGVTVPNITRMYDHNMQNNPNNDIKGDYAVKAKGSTALLQKETQARNMLNLVNFLMAPNLIGRVNEEKLTRKLVSAMQHDPDEILKSEPEYKKWLQEQQAAAQQGGDSQVQVQQMKNELAVKMHQDKLADRQADRQFNAYIQDKKIQLEMIKLNDNKELTYARMQANIQELDKKQTTARTLMADEFKVKLKTGSGI